MPWPEDVSRAGPPVPGPDESFIEAIEGLPGPIGFVLGKVLRFLHWETENIPRRAQGEIAAQEGPLGWLAWAGTEEKERRRAQFLRSMKGPEASREAWVKRSKLGQVPFVPLIADVVLDPILGMGPIAKLGAPIRGLVGSAVRGALRVPKGARKSGTTEIRGEVPEEAFGGSPSIGASYNPMGGSIYGPDPFEKVVRAERDFRKGILPGSKEAEGLNEIVRLALGEEKLKEFVALSSAGNQGANFRAAVIINSAVIRLRGTKDAEDLVPEVFKVSREARAAEAPAAGVAGAARVPQTVPGWFIEETPPEALGKLNKMLTRYERGGVPEEGDGAFLRRLLAQEEGEKPFLSDAFPTDNRRIVRFFNAVMEKAAGVGEGPKTELGSKVVNPRQWLDWYVKSLETGTRKRYEAGGLKDVNEVIRGVQLGRVAEGKTWLGLGEHGKSETTFMDLMRETGERLAGTKAFRSLPQAERGRVVLEEVWRKHWLGRSREEVKKMSREELLKAEADFRMALAEWERAAKNLVPRPGEVLGAKVEDAGKLVIAPPFDAEGMAGGLPLTLAAARVLARTHAAPVGTEYGVVEWMGKVGDLGETIQKNIARHTTDVKATDPTWTREDGVIAVLAAGGRRKGEVLFFKRNGEKVTWGAKELAEAKTVALEEFKTGGSAAEAARERFLKSPEGPSGAPLGAEAPPKVPPKVPPEVPPEVPLGAVAEAPVEAAASAAKAVILGDESAIPAAIEGATAAAAETTKKVLRTRRAKAAQTESARVDAKIEDAKARMAPPEEAAEELSKGGTLDTPREYSIPEGGLKREVRFWSWDSDRPWVEYGLENVAKMMNEVGLGAPAAVARKLWETGMFDLSRQQRLSESLAKYTDLFNELQAARRGTGEHSLLHVLRMDIPKVLKEAGEKDALDKETALVSAMVKLGASTSSALVAVRDRSAIISAANRAWEEKLRVYSRVLEMLQLDQAAALRGLPNRIVPTEKAMEEAEKFFVGTDVAGNTEAIKELLTQRNFNHVVRVMEELGLRGVGDLAKYAKGKYGETSHMYNRLVTDLKPIIEAQVNIFDPSHDVNLIKYFAVESRTREVERAATAAGQAKAKAGGFIGWFLRWQKEVAVATEAFLMANELFRPLAAMRQGLPVREAAKEMGERFGIQWAALRGKFNDLGPAEREHAMLAANTRAVADYLGIKIPGILRPGRVGMFFEDDLRTGKMATQSLQSVVMTTALGALSAGPPGAVVGAAYGAALSKLSPLIRDIDRLGDFIARGSIWERAVPAHLNRAMPGFIERTRAHLQDAASEARELGANAISDEIASAVLEKFGKTNGLMGEHHVANVLESFGIDKALKVHERVTSDWRDVVRAASDAGAEVAARVQILPRVRNAEEGMKLIFLFSMWASRAIPWFAEAFLEHPAFAALVMRQWSNSMEEARVKGLPDSLNKTTAVAWPQMAGLGALMSLVYPVAGQLRVNPLTAVVPPASAFSVGSSPDVNVEDWDWIVTAGRQLGYNPNFIFSWLFSVTGMLGATTPSPEFMRHSQFIRSLTGVDLEKVHRERTDVLRALTGQEPGNYEEFATRERVREILAGKGIDPLSPQAKAIEANTKGPIYQQALAETRQITKASSFASIFLPLPVTPRFVSSQKLETRQERANVERGVGVRSDVAKIIGSALDLVAPGTTTYRRMSFAPALSPQDPTQGTAEYEGQPRALAEQALAAFYTWAQSNGIRKENVWDRGNVERYLRERGEGRAEARRSQVPSLRYLRP